MSKRNSDRLHDVRRQLERSIQHGGLWEMNGGDAAKAERIVKKIEAAANEYAALIAPPEPPRVLTLIERINSLVDALETVAKERGALALKADSLHALVTANSVGIAVTYWAAQMSVQVQGHIQHEPQVASLLGERDVLVWHRDRDSLVRLVHTGWLQTHESIFDFVTGPAPAGQRCRFCRLHETNSIELTDCETPKAAWGATALTIRSLSHVHEQCAPHWLRWVGIARQYGSAEAARDADIAAGRTQGVETELPAFIAAPAMQAPSVEVHHRD